MSRLIKLVTIGLDLAGAETNPSGFAIMKNKKLHVCHLYATSEILESIITANPQIVAIDAPLSLPRKGAMRTTDKLMNSRGYRVFPPLLPSMKKLTQRAIKIKETLERKNYRIIEVHPTSTCKALQLPIKDWRKIQDAIEQMGLKGDPSVRALSPHEIDATAAALTGWLYLKGKTELIGDEREGYIVVPKRMSWSQLKL